MKNKKNLKRCWYDGKMFMNYSCQRIKIRERSFFDFFFKFEPCWSDVHFSGREEFYRNPTCDRFKGYIMEGAMYNDKLLYENDIIKVKFPEWDKSYFFLISLVSQTDMIMATYSDGTHFENIKRINLILDKKTDFNVVGNIFQDKNNEIIKKIIIA